MTMEQMKKAYGEEYPAAVVHDGERLPLFRESRFSRLYQANKMGCEISRFMDGSASMTFLTLQHEWPSWSANERSDFCQACCWLHEQADFPDMLRFIMQHGDSQDWAGIALSVAGHLPCQEAFDLLAGALRRTEINPASNIAQGIAATKHEQAERFLRDHLDTIWNHGKLWDDADFTNWVAFDATTCIAHLIELGAAPGDFEDRVRRLSKHPCKGNRNSCRNYLAKHYAWLS